MKSLVRWSATVGLVGSVLFGSVLASTMQVLALPQEQIVQKLRSVPVFTIANSQGAPLVASPPQGQKGQPVAFVFISRQDAQKFLDTLKTKNPPAAKDTSVVLLSLAEVYQLATSTKGKPDRVDFEFVPSQQQVETAVSLLKKSGQQVQQFNGTPLFFATGGKDKGYLTVRRGDQTVIPMFFKKEELQLMLDSVKQRQPDVVSAAEIQVTNLEGLIEIMRTKNDAPVTQVELVPSRESIEYIRSLQPKQQAQPKPQAAPKK